jgi:hypothetical protein
MAEGFTFPCLAHVLFLKLFAAISFRRVNVAYGASDLAPPASSSARTEGLSVVLSQVVVQRGRVGFFQQRPEHHVLAATFGETGAVFFPQRAYPGVTVLLVNFAAFVTVTAVKTAMPLCHGALPWIA